MPDKPERPALWNAPTGGEIVGFVIFNNGAGATTPDEPMFVIKKEEEGDSDEVQED